MEGSSSSSSAFFGMRDEEEIRNQIKRQAVPSSSSIQAPPPSLAPPLPSKKRRNQPGAPNPDAEVIALSPKTLMATNRFVCEVCNKGFQREQNLQLHRRGHNLPWKLKQKSTKEVKRRVYLCPEPTCVHHDPSRALGDLTGIKKHFCRKHGEKKWKCDKCSKRYAVQSDWKAHSKTCGTREYRCDCGTLFSRRDSFITHRAFCDALAQESTRFPAGLSSIGTTHDLLLYGNRNDSQQMISLHELGPPQINHPMLSPTDNPQLLRPSELPSHSSGFFLGGTSQGFEGDKASHFHDGLVQTLDDHNVSAPSHEQLSASTFFNLSFFSNTNTPTTNVGNNNNSKNVNLTITDDHFIKYGGNTGTGNTVQRPNIMNFCSGNLLGDSRGAGINSTVYNTDQLSNKSTLSQMSATALLQKAAQMGSMITTINHGQPVILVGGNSRSHLESEANLQDLMDSLSNGNTAAIFRGNQRRQQRQEITGYGGFNPNLSLMRGPETLTRDFLGVGGMVRNLMTQIEHQHHHDGFDLHCLHPETKTVVNSSGSYADGSWQ